MIAVLQQFHFSLKRGYLAFNKYNSVKIILKVIINNDEWFNRNFYLMARYFGFHYSKTYFWKKKNWITMNILL